MANKKYFLLIFLLCLALGIFALDSSFRLNWLTFPLRRVLSPVQQLASGAYNLILTPVRMVSFIRSGEQRIKFLEQRNLELLTKVNEDDSLRKENVDLKKQLGADISKSHFLEPAKVLGIERYLEFQVNNSEKMKIGQSVVYLDNYIGRIVKIGSGIGYAQLVTDPDSKIPSKTDFASGLAVGQFSSDVLFDKVSKSDTLNINDRVLTSGIGGMTAPDLVIGTVSKIVPSSDELFQRGLVVPNIKISDLSEVYIIVD